MLIRVVRMEFEAGKIPAFLEIFKNSSDKIKSFEGCFEVILKRDPQNAQVYYTHSLWKDEDALNHYRDSAFFKETWDKTKALFSAKPQAFSLVDV